MKPCLAKQFARAYFAAGKRNDDFRTLIKQIDPKVHISMHTKGAALFVFSDDSWGECTFYDDDTADVWGYPKRARKGGNLGL